MKASEVVTAVRRHYGCESDSMGPEWAALTEFTLAPGVKAMSRIDLFMVRAWSGKPKGHERHSIEVKVSRSDFLAEVARPWKRAPWEAVSHRFYFAAPAGLIDPSEVPDGCGLLEAHPYGCIQIVRAPKTADPDPVPETAFVEAFRRASRAEARVRSAGHSDPAARVVSLQAQVDSLTLQVTTRDNALDRERDRTRYLLGVAAADRQFPCEKCGEPMRLDRRAFKHSPTGLHWVHVTASDCYFGQPDHDAMAVALIPGDDEP